VQKEKEAEIKEILKQQESLLHEKEAILNKLSKTHQKILDLKQRQHQDDSKGSRIDSLPPRPQSSQANKQTLPEEVKVAQNETKKPSNDMFNPFKV
jgi:hypothetical protein